MLSIQLKKTQASRIIVPLLLSIALSPSVIKGEHLPLKIYTTADGLAHNLVNRIVPDSRGFLWFCTFEGLSRFDGYSFTTYGVAQGLPSQVVNDLLETRDGQYWLATDAGLSRLNPKGTPGKGGAESGTANVMFAVYRPGEDPKSKQVTALLQDHNGVIWCGTGRGLYRLEQSAGEVRFQFIDLGMPPADGENRNVVSMIEDRRGILWIGSKTGIYRLLPNGQTEHYDERHGLPDAFIHCFFEDREGRIWAGSHSGLYLLISNPDPAGAVVDRVYSVKDGFPSAWITQLLQASDGSLWAGSADGLIRFIPAGTDFRFRLYSKPEGLNSVGVSALTEDHYGNLWLGVGNGGAAKLSRSGITSFGEADGFTAPRAIFKDTAGDLYVVAGPDLVLSRFDHERFTSIHPNVHGYGGWGWNQQVVEDQTGEWWVATGNGLYRFPKVASFDRLAFTPPKAVYSTNNGLASNDIVRVFEDSRGDIWIGAANKGDLSRWDKARQAFHHFSEQDGLPALLNFYPISFAEDRQGSIWIGFSFDGNSSGGLVRYRDGRFTRFTSADGLTEGGIFNLFIDSLGRLWVPTTRGGVCRIDYPEADHPTILKYTVADGLSSGDVKAVTEDREGRIYLGTGRGIDRLDPTTGHIRYYTINEGVLTGNVNAALQDRDGGLWFSYATGLLRLIPEPDLAPTPPPVLITGLRIAGESQPISALGEVSIKAIELAANNQLQLDFVAPGFSPGEGLRYQYELEGTGQDWSPPGDQRTVNFAHLAPGRYRFLVRAIDADGVISDRPASFAFTILPPVWQRWWFIGLAALAISGAAYALYRYRVARILEVASMRTRIATDLHDDIGANLTKIAILSEVAKQQQPNGNQEDTPLSSIARISRESVAAMSDIVWAINPQRDHLIDLVRRMRREAGDIFAARDIKLSFNAPGDGQDLRLGVDVRRDLFLIFKEAINNAARHSQCRNLTIDFQIDGSFLALLVADDGVGFDISSEPDGHGLENMRQRAAALGGELSIRSGANQGTTIHLRIPNARSRRLLAQKDGTYPV